jgi:GntR family transcriptional regulator, rspAB operon transcriptional repressor
MAYDFLRAKRDSGRPLREQVYDALRQAIVTGRMAPNETIGEKEIAAKLRISRTPVREALKQLSDEHLVEVIAQSGTRVAPLDRHELHEAFLIRRALETESVSHAVPNMSPQHAEALSELIVTHARAIDARDFVQAINVDDSFHRYISIEIASLPILSRTVDISRAQLDRCRHKMLPRPGEGLATLEQHREIVRALNSGDPEKAKTAMTNHLDSAYASTVRALDAEQTEAA